MFYLWILVQLNIFFFICTKMRLFVLILWPKCILHGEIGSFSSIEHFLFIIRLFVLVI